MAKRTVRLEFTKEVLEESVIGKCGICGRGPLCWLTTRAGKRAKAYCRQHEDGTWLACVTRYHDCVSEQRYRIEKAKRGSYKRWLGDLSKPIKPWGPAKEGEEEKEEDSLS